MTLPPHRVAGALGGIRPSQVAADYNVPMHVVWYWLRISNIFPQPVFTRGRYEIPRHYVVLNPALRPQWDTKYHKPTGRPVGRPKGVKNSRPYPTGVKRPRRVHSDAASPKK